MQIALTIHISMIHCMLGPTLRCCAAMALIIMFRAPVVHAQPTDAPSQTDTLEGMLPVIEIEAVRATESTVSAPFAVALISRSDDRIAIEPSLWLQDLLAPMPGIFVNNRGHYAMGERITIRGMGWRSAFGVRGVVIVMDGVPLTMPDGQAFADILDPAVVRSAELLRGPASVFWGNAAGGVLYLRTAPRSDAPFLRARVLAGTYGERHFLAETSFQAGRSAVHLYGSHIEQSGFREYSSGRFERGGLNATIPVGRASILNVTAVGAYQDTEHPGSLTLGELEADRSQADARYTRTLSGKESFQLQAATTLRHQLPGATVSVTTYGILRNLDNPLPFAFVELDRLAGGARALVQRDQSAALRWTLGLDSGVQRDDRRNFNNAGGVPGDTRNLDQLETVRNVAAFVLGSLSPLASLDVSAGVRFDAVDFTMQDRFLDNGDESGSRRFHAFSPTMGVSYRIFHSLIFANFATAFETPTTTELVNRPDAAGGFNPELDPQHTRGLEVGIRGSIAPAMITYDVAAFRMTVRDILVQYESETEIARTYFRNAGNNVHGGFEIVATALPLTNIGVVGSYSFNRLRFNSGDLTGNELPGVPRHRGYLASTWTQRGVRLGVGFRVASGYFVDEANEVESDGYALLELNAAHQGIRIGAAMLSPFFELMNALDATYNASVVVNATGGRFYEPGPGRVFRAGMNVRI